MTIAGLAVPQGLAALGATDGQGRTPLHLVVSYQAGSWACFQELMLGPAPHATLDSSGSTPLLCAIANISRTANGVDMAMQLCTNAPDDIVNKANRNGQTPLLLACQNYSVLAVEALLKRPHTDPNLPDLKGDRALFLALKGASECNMLASRIHACTVSGAHYPLLLNNHTCNTTCRAC